MRRFTSKVYFRLTISFLFLIFSLAAFSGCGGVSDEGSTGSLTGSVTLSWQAPTTNADGTPLTDLAGYKVYYGEHSGDYTYPPVTVGNFTSASIGDLPSGKTLYFVVTAYDTSGNESSPSGEVNTVL